MKFKLILLIITVALAATEFPMQAMRNPSYLARARQSLQTAKRNVQRGWQRTKQGWQQTRKTARTIRQFPKQHPLISYGLGATALTGSGWTYRYIQENKRKLAALNELERKIKQKEFAAQELYLLEQELQKPFEKANKETVTLVLQDLYTNNKYNPEELEFAVLTLLTHKDARWNVLLNSMFADQDEKPHNEIIIKTLPILTKSFDQLLKIAPDRINETFINIIKLNPTLIKTLIPSITSNIEQLMNITSGVDLIFTIANHDPKSLPYSLEVLVKHVLANNNATLTDAFVEVYLNQKNMEKFLPMFKTFFDKISSFDENSRNNIARVLRFIIENSKKEGVITSDTKNIAQNFLPNIYNNAALFTDSEEGIKLLLTITNALMQPDPKAGFLAKTWKGFQKNRMLKKLQKLALETKNMLSQNPYGIELLTIFNIKPQQIPTQSAEQTEEETEIQPTTTQKEIVPPLETEKPTKGPVLPETSIPSEIITSPDIAAEEKPVDVTVFTEPQQKVTTEPETVEQPSIVSAPAEEPLIQRTEEEQILPEVKATVEEIIQPEQPSESIPGYEVGMTEFSESEAQPFTSFVPPTTQTKEIQKPGYVSRVITFVTSYPIKLWNWLTSWFAKPQPTSEQEEAESAQIESAAV